MAEEEVAYSSRSCERKMKIVDLSGVWGFCLDVEKQGIEKKYYMDNLNDTIQLPSTTALSKKGQYNNLREVGYLTEEYPFTGYAWYSRKIVLEEGWESKVVTLFLERTRISSVWVNGQYVGTKDSLCTGHEYNITEYITDKTVQISILINNSDYVTKGGHLTSPDTQTNWNGIMGKIELRIYGAIYIESVQAYPNIENKSVVLRYQVQNTTVDTQAIKIYLYGDKKILTRENNIEVQHGILPLKADTVKIKPGTNQLESVYSVQELELWGEYNPVYYELHMGIEEGKYDVSVPFGFRKFEAKEHYFYINGIKTFLRGKHDGLIFPLTGAAPMEVEEWIRILQISKSYGINHYRYHTCCPPEAAFIAADLVGIYMQPELPFWGTLTAPDEDGHKEEEQQFLIKEGERMLQAYGNHPSFVMMSLGNELWGSSKQMGKIIRRYKELDGRHLYTEGCNNFQFTPVILEEDDFFVGVRFSKDRLIRGSYGMCDAPLGFVQTEEPNSLHNYDNHILPEKENGGNHESGIAENEEIEIQFGTGTKKVKAVESAELIPNKPVISHEIGQYAVYPNFKEIDKYTGPLKARNFEVFRERLEEKGLLDLAEDYFWCSGKLAVDCYKLELEAAHRSNYLAGYQILDLQDFSGQGTALVGILDSFMDSKGLVDRNWWRGYCSDAVLMAEFPTFNFEAGQKVTAKIDISYYRPQELLLESFMYLLNDGIETIASGGFNVTITELGVQSLGTIELEFPFVEKTKRLTLVIAIPNADIFNSYEFYVHPSKESHGGSKLEVLPSKEGVTFITKNDMTLVVAETMESARPYLEKGERVLLLPTLSVESSIEGQYCTDFWCYPMFKGISEWMKKPIPVGTMGLLVDKDHPAINRFAVEKYATPQWYHIVMASRLAILDETVPTWRPIVQMIDNFERNHKLGLLFEANVLEGKLLVCTSVVAKIADKVEVMQFIDNIVRYGLSAEFHPKETLGYELLRKILK